MTEPVPPFPPPPGQPPQEPAGPPGVGQGVVGPPPYVPSPAQPYAPPQQWGLPPGYDGRVPPPPPGYPQWDPTVQGGQPPVRYAPPQQWGPPPPGWVPPGWGPPPKKSRGRLILVLSLVAVLLIGGGVTTFLLVRDSGAADVTAKTRGKVGDTLTLIDADGNAVDYTVHEFILAKGNDYPQPAKEAVYAAPITVKVRAGKLTLEPYALTLVGRDGKVPAEDKLSKLNGANESITLAAGKGADGIALFDLRFSDLVDGKLTVDIGGGPDAVGAWTI